MALTCGRMALSCPNGLSGVAWSVCMLCGMRTLSWLESAKNADSARSTEHHIHHSWQQGGVCLPNQINFSNQIKKLLTQKLRNGKSNQKVVNSKLLKTSGLANQMKQIVWMFSVHVPTHLVQTWCCFCWCTCSTLMSSWADDAYYDDSGMLMHTPVSERMCPLLASAATSHGSGKSWDTMLQPPGSIDHACYVYLCFSTACTLSREHAIPRGTMQLGRYAWFSGQQPCFQNNIAPHCMHCIHSRTHCIQKQHAVLASHHNTSMAVLIPI